MTYVTSEIYISGMPPDMLPRVFKRDDGKRKGLGGGYGEPQAGHAENRRQNHEAGHEQDDAAQECVGR